MRDCIIIIPTHSSYLDVCFIALELIDKNWYDNNIPIVLSYYGDKKKEIETKFKNRYRNLNIVFNNDTSKLPRCIYNVTIMFDAKCYMILLGDAFISDSVNNDDINGMIDEFLTLNGEYLRLKYPPLEVSKKTVGKYFYKISSAQRYAHTFVAFLASKDFIAREFFSNTDYDFEVKYLKQTANKNAFYYEKRFALRMDVMHIIPGIIKGRWDRHVKSDLELKYPDIDFSERKVLPVCMQIKVDLISFFEKRISSKNKGIIKEFISRVFPSFFVTNE